ncbi:exonuclease [Kwoniella heveanensis BCC8398]|uniref:Mitochondrial escape protein 2 n=1 Tax=Kwoniella heveanensis BCC8398 TaxID=1296120 RepID=A0A1B9GZB3_9TREE|nr:exonuclease [Kwoniella heveanensis BCC8398]
MIRPRPLSIPIRHVLRRGPVLPSSTASILCASHPAISFPRPTLSLSVSRHNSTSTATSIDDSPPLPQAARSEPPSPRSTGSFYISNVLPIKLSYWDFRTSIGLLREEALMERIHDIARDVDLHGFRVESLEASRKDGGVFLHFSYIPPSISASASKGIFEGTDPEIAGQKEAGTSTNAGSAEDASKDRVAAPLEVIPDSPGKLFIPALEESASRNGGWPSWLGDWWASRKLSIGSSVPGHALYSTSSSDTYSDVLAKTSGSSSSSSGDKEKESGILRKGDEGEKKGLQAMVGDGRIWVVKGRQWTEDMNRFPSPRLRVEFDGPDVSQEMLYTLFRPYGRVADITPPSPVPAGSLRFATISFSRVSPAVTAINCLHGFSTPTNTADFTLRASGAPSSAAIPKSRLRVYYERPLKAHAVREWISSHPRLALPVIAFLIGTLSYTFFDPIRAFFVRSKLEGVWDLEQYSLIKMLRKKFVLPTSFGFLGSSGGDPSEEAIGKDAWQDRVQAEKDVERWLSEYPGTFITITGPPGSGKVCLVTRVLKQQQKPALVIDCAEIAKAKNDKNLLDALADQTGYYPVFSFMSSLSGLIDLAAVGLIGQKAGFSTPVDQQLRQMLEIVGGALKDVSNNAQHAHQEEVQDAKTHAEALVEKERLRRLIARGGWHDGRLDCVAGNGAMSELGVGDEPYFESDLDVASPPLMDDTAPIKGEAVPPTAASLPMAQAPSAEEEAAKAAQAAATADLDAESEQIRSLPIVVLKNFAQKTAKGDLWNVLAEWGASLVENKVAHVIVITEGATATKALTKALPAKPLNSVGLADADESNALAYVKDKLRSNQVFALSVEDSAQVAKLGGRMVDLETLVYKVRTGASIKDAVDDIILRNTVELRKAAFGDDSEDAKALPWNRAQAWRVVKDLAAKGEISYAQLLQDFPFKGAEQSLKALEEHELVSVTYVDGRASKLKPGKPVFRYAFEALVNDPVFRASCQIEYNAALIAKAEADIRSYETELTTLKGITTEGGSEALGVNGGWLTSGHSAIRDRAKWLLDKMGKGVEKTVKLEKENEEMAKVLASGRA